MPPSSPARPPAGDPSAAEVVGTSRALAATLRTGTHRLGDRSLRRIYGVGTVSPAVRIAIGRELERAGLELVGTPGRGPVVVRQRAPGADDGLGLGGGTAGRRPVALAAAALVVVAALVAGTALDGSGGDPAGLPAAASRPATTARVPPSTASTTAAVVVLPADLVLGAAADAAQDDRYATALALARRLGPDAEARIGRKASRRLAARADVALDAGRRGQARTLLEEARRYPSTPELASGRRRLATADRRARAARAAATATTTATVPVPTTASVPAPATTPSAVAPGTTTTP